MPIWIGPRMDKWTSKEEITGDDIEWGLRKARATTRRDLETFVQSAISVIVRSPLGT